MKKKDLIELGSTSLIDWMRECMDSIEKRFSELYKEGDSVFHIDMTDLDSFKKSVEQYAKDHPNAKIVASGFMMSTEEPTKEWKYEK